MTPTTHTTAARVGGAAAPMDVGALLGRAVDELAAPPVDQKGQGEPARGCKAHAGVEATLRRIDSRTRLTLILTLLLLLQAIGVIVFRLPFAQ